MPKVRAKSMDRSCRVLGSDDVVFSISLRYLSTRVRSKLAWLKSCEALTKTPGLLRTAERKLLKSPPVSGARNSTACCASLGTVTKVPSARTCLFQVSTRVNQFSGGGLV